MEDAARPKADLAQRVLPKGLWQALQLVLARAGAETMLVGGTALSGFYAGHRRSDDLDLFCKSPAAFEATRRAVERLTQDGAKLDSPFASGAFYRTVAEFKRHVFTIDVVLDENAFAAGQRLEAAPNLGIASLLTILKMKSATLVSRCGEKDLYDLLWLFEKFPQMSLAQFVEFGREIDAGVNAESMLYALGSTTLSRAACNFTLPAVEDSAAAFERLVHFQRELIRQLSVWLHESQDPGPLGAIVKFLRGN